MGYVGRGIGSRSACTSTTRLLSAGVVIGGGRTQDILCGLVPRVPGCLPVTDLFIQWMHLESVPQCLFCYGGWLT